MRHKTKMPFNHSTISSLLILHMEHRSIDNWSIEVQHSNRTIPKNTQEHLTFLALQSILQSILQSSLSHTYHEENMSIPYEPYKTNNIPRLIPLALLKQLFIITIHLHPELMSRWWRLILPETTSVYLQTLPYHVFQTSKYFVKSFHHAKVLLRHTRNWPDWQKKKEDYVTVIIPEASNMYESNPSK